MPRNLVIAVVLLAACGLATAALVWLKLHVELERRRGRSVRVGQLEMAGLVATAGMAAIAAYIAVPTLAVAHLRDTSGLGKLGLLAAILAYCAMLSLVLALANVARRGPACMRSAIRPRVMPCAWESSG